MNRAPVHLVYLNASLKVVIKYIQLDFLIKVSLGGGERSLEKRRSDFEKHLGFVS